MAPLRDNKLYWTVFVFDMSECIVHVMDPKRSCLGEDALYEFHKTTCDMLVQALAKCASKFPEGWEVIPEKFTIKCYAGLHDSNNCAHSSFDMVHYAFYFDGDSLVKERTRVRN